jgi:N-acetylmuramoyl-L-alanine amidase
MHRGICLLALAFACLLPLPATAAEVESVRLWAGPERTRVVFDLSQPVEHRVFTLQNPDRIVIDFSGTRLTASGFPSSDGVVAGMRSGVRNARDLRVVLDLETGVRPRSFLVPPNEQYGHRLVVDLDGRAPGVEPQRRPAQETPRGETRPLIIAIDAGHGGEDPGAIGPGGTREKDVVLQIARRLAQVIEAEPGMEPFMVRTGDYFLAHRERVKRARDAEADLFISLHADAFKDSRARGASVYALSQRGATSEAAQWLADRENMADLIGGVRLSDKDDTVASVLMDLSQTASISTSLDIGDRLLGRMGRHVRLHKREVLQAGFMVLKAPDIPSLLVETAFISNPQEERLLNQAEYHRNLSMAILEGIREYFYENPVPGTMVAELARNGQRPAREHVISRGDTLSGIARQYQVSVQAIRQTNGLNGDRIRVGETLRIPAAGDS